MRIFCFVLLLFPFYLYAQIEYTQDLQFSKDFPSRSLIAVAIADVNGDARDDIIRINNGQHLEMIYFDDHNSKMEVIDKAMPVGEPWSIAVANLTNNHRSEIVLSNAFEDSYIIHLDEKQSPVSGQTVENSAYSQSTSIADIDNDGWLDIFVASDDSQSKVLRNDGTGKMIEDDSMIDLNTRIPSDNSGNYGTEWTDIDSDGDIDLYISKCKAGVTNPNDPRRINMLYVNDGNGNYTENAAAFRLAFGQQSWASNFGDFDNDGDLDAIVIHHESPHSLLENIDNQFMDRGDKIGGLESLAYQVLVRDFDNNGFQDILITGDRDYMLWNRGGFDFQMEESPFVHYHMISMATGDLNRDGFLDFIGVYGGEALNKPGNVGDVLWYAEPNNHHFVSLNLQGVQSNKSGIGARVKIFGDWGVQIRDVKAGESYSISNSLNVHFGLGQSEMIDRVEIHWPSGQVDSHTNIPADRFYSVTEGSCISPIKHAETTIQRCTTNNIKLTARGYEAMWQDGSVSDSYQVEKEGLYFAIIDDAGCRQIRESIHIRGFDEALIEIPDVVMSCNDEAISFDYRDGFGMSQTMTVDPASVTGQIDIPDICDTGAGTIAVESLTTSTPSFSELVYQEGDDALILSDNDANWSWYLSENDDTPFYTGDSLYIPMIEEDKTFYVEEQTGYQYPSVHGGEYNFSGSSKYSGNQFHGGLYFHAHEDMVIEELTVYTDTAGVREIIISSEEGQIVYNKRFDLSRGFNRLELSAGLAMANNYFIHTNASLNETNFGYKSPRLVRSNNATQYPYFIDDIATIINSSFGPAYYLYFYNWQIRKADALCHSPRVKVDISVDNSTAIDDEFQDKDVNIYPNPATDRIYVDFPNTYQFVNAKLYNALGKQVMTMTTLESLNSSHLVSGHYILELAFGHKVVRTQLIVSHN